MPDAAGRPTLNDWTQLTAVANNIGDRADKSADHQLKLSEYARAQQAEEQKLGLERQTASLTNALINNEPVDETAADPRALMEARRNAVKYQSDALSNTETARKIRSNAYSQDLEALRRSAKAARVAFEAGDMDRFTRLTDAAYAYVPDGQRIVGRNGAAVEMEAATGKKETLTDNLPPQEKLQFLEQYAQDEKAYFNQAESLRQSRREFNDEQWRAPEARAGEDGNTYYVVRQQDPWTGGVTELMFDHVPTAASEPLQTPGAQNYYTQKALAEKLQQQGLDEKKTRMTIQGLELIEKQFPDPVVDGVKMGGVSAEKQAAINFYLDKALAGDDPADAAIEVGQAVKQRVEEYFNALDRKPQDAEIIQQQFKKKYGFLPETPFK